MIKRYLKTYYACSCTCDTCSYHIAKISFELLKVDLNSKNRENSAFKVPGDGDLFKIFKFTEIRIIVENKLL